MCTRLDPADCADCIAPKPNVIQRTISKSSVQSFRRDVAEAFEKHNTIFVSNMLKRNFERVAGPREWGVVLHNFVDLEKIQTALAKTPTPLNTGEQKLQIFIAGMLYPPKGIGDLLQIFAPIMPPNMQLIIAGSGPDEQRLRQTYESNQVTFLGWCNYSTVLNYVKVCDVIVVPSICEESCATTILEGLALGKPTYALGRGGTPELTAYERYPQQLRLFPNMEELAINLALFKTNTQFQAAEGFSGNVDNCVVSLLQIYQDRMR